MVFEKDDFIAYTLNLDYTDKLHSSWESCPARNAALFLQDQWKQVEQFISRNAAPNLTVEEGAFSRVEFRRQLVVTYVTMAEDWNASHGQMPIVWVTRGSQVFSHTGKARKVNIRPNFVPSRSVGADAVLPSQFERGYVTDPPPSVEKESKDEFFKMLGILGHDVLCLRVFFLSIFTNMAKGCLYKDCFVLETHQYASSLKLYGAVPYEVLFDSFGQAREKLRNLRKKYGMTSGCRNLEQLLGGTHLSPSNQMQWRAALSVFSPNLITQLWENSQSGEETNIESSFHLHHGAMNGFNFPTRVSRQLGACTRRAKNYWQVVQLLLHQGQFDHVLLEAIVEMRTLRCRLRGIRYLSSIDPNNEEEIAEYALKLPESDRTKRLTEVTYKRIWNDAERLLGYFKMHHRHLSLSTMDVKIREVIEIDS